jgi:RNA polymerase primary sigma factor
MSESVGEFSVALAEPQRGNVGADLNLYTVYMNQACVTPLLDANKEREIAKTVEVGVLAEEKLAIAEARGEILPLQLRLDLRELRQEGRQAKDHLFEANTRLVAAIAEDYVCRGLAKLDLIQEGNIGLMHAIEMYDYTTKGNRLGTYAAYWIRQAMRKALSDQGRAIRLPLPVVADMLSCKKAADELRQELFQEPTYDDIAERVDMKPDAVENLLTVSRPIFSLSQPADADGKLLIEDRVALKPLKETGLTAEQMLLRDMTEDIGTDVLTADERQILQLRFGRKEPPTRAEIATILSVSEAVVTALEHRALAVLGHPALGLQNTFLDDTKRQDWQEAAACHDQNVLDFFPRGADKKMREAALRVCADCPVKMQCAEYALQNRITVGIWGELIPAERKKRLKTAGSPS